MISKEQLNSRVYKRRVWKNESQLNKGLNELEVQVEEITKRLIDDIFIIDEEVEKGKVQIKIDTEGLSLRVEQATNRLEDNSYDLDNQNAKIHDRIEEFKEGYVRKEFSEIRVGVDKIELEVNDRIDGLAGEVSEHGSLIQQTSEKIELTVSKLNHVGEEIEEISSRITQTAEEIEMAIEDATEPDRLVTSLNLSSEGVVVKGKKIQLNGETLIEGDFKVTGETIVLTGDTTVEGSFTVDGNNAQIILGGNTKVLGNFDIGEFDNAEGKFSGTKISNGTISTSHIEVNGLNADVIKSGYIKADRIETESLTADKLKVGENFEVDEDGNLLVSYIDAGVITTGELNVGGDLIIKGTIDGTDAKFKNLSAESITVGKINGYQIAEGSITGGNLETGAIGATELKVGSIYTNHISSKAITTDKLHIGDNFSVDSKGNLVASTIDASSIKSGTIDANRITIGATSITDGAISTSHINVDGLNADIIKTGLLKADRIDLGAGFVASNGKLEITEINAENINVKNINGENILGKTIGNESIKDGAIGDNNIAEGTINGNKIVIGSIESMQIASDAITANKISAGAITTNKLNVGSNFSVNENGDLKVVNVEAESIKSGTIDANRISVGSTSIIDGAITVDKLSANSVTADKITANAITTEKIAAGAITADKIAANSINVGTISGLEESIDGKLQEGKVTINAETIFKGDASIVSSGENETTIIQGGSIIFTRDGKSITTFRNMRSGTVITDGTGKGYVDFKELNEELHILPSIKAFNLSSNVRTLNCKVEKDPNYLAENRWRFYIYGAEESYTDAVYKDITELSYITPPCYTASIHNVSMSASGSYQYNVNNGGLDSFYLSDHGTIIVKAYIGMKLYGTFTVPVTNYNISVYGNSIRLDVPSVDLTAFTNGVSFTTNLSEPKELRWEIESGNNLRVRGRYINPGSNENGTTSEFSVSCIIKAGHIKTSVSYSTSTIQKIIGDGEISYIAMEV